MRVLGRVESGNEVNSSLLLLSAYVFMYVAISVFSYTCNDALC